MIWMWVLGCQLVWLVPCQGVSRELFLTHTAQWVLPPVHEPKDAYFGYSVAYEPNRNRLLVSAPQHDEVGEIYSCDLNSSLNCTSVPKKDGLKKFESRRHNHWFGAVVKSGQSNFVACAPRFVERRHFEKDYDPGNFGRCYSYTDGSSINSISYLKSITDTQRKETPYNLYEHIMDSFGWSIDINGADIMLGGPAMYTGRAMKYMDQTRNPISMTGFWNNEKLIEYNFGYSIVSGHFKTVDNSRMRTRIYAIGSPYGKRGRGKVLFYEYTIGTTSTGYPRELGTDGENVVGSMFGATLSAARLTPDSHATALLVGAPTHANASTHQYNRGAVYFYKPARQLPLQQYYVKIVGQRDNSHFGSAIISVGDFNGDEMDEIAISAPYEDGIGAVYLYSSNDLRTDKFKDLESRGKPIRYMQRITPEPGPILTPAPSANSFGVSLATHVNEESGCNELAIGAPESNKVMVLKCIAFVTIKLQEPKLISNKDKSTVEFEDFTVQSCFKAEFPKKPEVITTKVNVVVELSHPDAKLDITEEYEKQLDRNKINYCHNFTLLAPKRGNYELPMNYKIYASENESLNTMGRVEPTHVALSDYSILNISNFMWLLNECKDREHCMPDLDLRHLNLQDTYKLGSSQSIQTDMSVKNIGEVAYSPCVRFFLRNTDVVAVPSGCERDDVAALLCRPSMPLRDKFWILPKMLLQTSHLTSEDKNIAVSIALYNHCSQEPKWATNKTISLITDSDIIIKAVTDSGLDHNVNMTKDDVDGKQFEHSYTISNNGKTPWVSVPAILVVQTRSFIEYSPIIIVSASSDSGKSEISSCEVLSKDTENVTYSCKIDRLYREPVKVTVPMMIKYGMLETAVSDNENTQFTSLTLDLHGEKKGSSERSTLNYVDNRVAIWIIIVASLVGLLILVILCIVLIRCGFFKRKEKENLERVRHSVRRQTMMKSRIDRWNYNKNSYDGERRTMVDGVRVPTDRQSLIGPVPVLSAEEAAATDRRVRLDSNVTRNMRGT